MAFLIFTTSSDAFSRNDKAGQDKNLPYHSGNGITRHPWAMLEEESGDNRAALEIEQDYDLLTDSEKQQLVDTLPDDWQHAADDA